MKPTDPFCAALSSNPFQDRFLEIHEDKPKIGGTETLKPWAGYQAPADDPGSGSSLQLLAISVCLCRQHSRPAPRKQVQGPRIPTPQAKTLAQSQDCRPLSHTAALRGSPSEAPLATRRQAGLLGSRSEAMATTQADICAMDRVKRGSPAGSGMRVRTARRAGLAGRTQRGLGESRRT